MRKRNICTTNLTVAVFKEKYKHKHYQYMISGVPTNFEWGDRQRRRQEGPSSEKKKTIHFTHFSTGLNL